MLCIIAVARESGASIVFVGAVALAVQFFFEMMGTLLCQPQVQVIPAEVFQTIWACVGVFLLLVAATFWIGNDRQAAKLWGMRREMTPQKFAQIELKGRCSVIAQRHDLTPKETEILQLTLAGRRPAQISEDLVVSVNTVRSHLRNIYAKTDVHSVAELERLSQSIDERDIVPDRKTAETAE